MASPPGGVLESLFLSHLWVKRLKLTVNNRGKKDGRSKLFLQPTMLYGCTKTTYKFDSTKLEIFLR